MILTPELGLSAVAILLTVGGIIFSTGRTNAKMEDDRKRSDEKFADISKEIEDKFEDIDDQVKTLKEWHKDHFVQIEALKIWQSAQNQINSNKSETLARIEAELKEMKKMLGKIMARRDGDQNDQGGE